MLLNCIGQVTVLHFIDGPSAMVGKRINIKGGRKGAAQAGYIVLDSVQPL